MIQQESNMAFDVEPESATTDFAEPFVCQTFDTTGAELELTEPRLIYLDLEELSCFEVVERQFEAWGVVFKNAIALNPSNPAFPPKSGQTVLMGSPRSGMLEATFSRPAKFVSAFVTTSHRAAMIAFDKDNKPLAEAEVPGANLADGHSSYEPNMRLSVKASNIDHICVRSLGGQFTIDDFAFGF